VKKEITIRDNSGLNVFELVDGKKYIINAENFSKDELYQLSRTIREEMPLSYAVVVNGKIGVELDD